MSDAITHVLLAVFVLGYVIERTRAKPCLVCDQRTIQAHKVEEAFRETLTANLSEIHDLRRRCDDLTKLQAEAIQPGIVLRAQAKPREWTRPPVFDEPQGPEMPPLS